MLSFTLFPSFPGIFHHFSLSWDRPPRSPSNALALRTKLPAVSQRIQELGW